MAGGHAPGATAKQGGIYEVPRAGPSLLIDVARRWSAIAFLASVGGSFQNRVKWSSNGLSQHESRGECFSSPLVLRLGLAVLLRRRRRRQPQPESHSADF